MSAIIQSIAVHPTKVAAYWLAKRYGGEVVETTAHGSFAFGIAGSRADEQAALECAMFAVATQVDGETMFAVSTWVRDEDGLLIVEVRADG
jgi:hypothetical protein